MRMANGVDAGRRWVAPAVAALLALALAACGGGGNGGGDAPAPTHAWVGTWAVAPTGPASLTESAAFIPAVTYENQTVRMILRSSVAGHRLRVRLSNEIGDAPAPVRIAAAQIALRGHGSAVVPGSQRALSFDGQPEVTIAPRGAVFSDPVDLPVAALADLALSLYLPDKTVVQSAHFFTRQTHYVAPGNAAAAASLDGLGADTMQTWLLATGVDVATERPMALIALGDSITDGVGDATVRVDGPMPWPSWPSRLAQRLATHPQLARLAVLNAAIAGNRVLSDAPKLSVTARAVFGPAAIQRFQRDVVQQSGASCVVILHGINDLTMGVQEKKPVTAEQVIEGHKQLIGQARAGGLSVIGATLLPLGGYPYAAPENEAQRQALNHWIRTSGAYDAVVDFDAVLRDAARPAQLLPIYDSGDHLHPSDVGYQAMADSIDTEMLQRLCVRT